MSKTIREVLEELYHAPRMNDLNPTAWGSVYIDQALAEIEGMVVPSAIDIQEVIIDFLREERFGEPSNILRQLQIIEFPELAKRIHAMLKERVK